MARRKARAAGFEGAYASIESKKSVLGDGLQMRDAETNLKRKSKKGKKSVLGVSCKCAMRKQTENEKVKNILNGKMQGACSRFRGSVLGYVTEITCCTATPQIAVQNVFFRGFRQ
ncbi:MAG: hypothetical protein J1F29_06265 [Lentimicrobiaceae bacterium]|nr:hypothetical protein [Lentimicrobiaceae bacterium]